MVGKYKEAVRYLRSQQLAVPHPDILRKANRQVMLRYINKADDARLQGTLMGHLVNNQGAALTRAEQRQLRGRLLTRAAISAIARTARKN